MHKYLCTGTSIEGKTVKKTVIAVNSENAIDMVPEIETVISVEDKGEEFHPPKWMKGKLKKQVIADMFDQVRMLLNTGYSSLEAFNTITMFGADQIRRVSLLISDDLTKGISLSESFARNKEPFGYDYSVQIKSAESTATVPEVLESIANQLRSEVEVAQRTSKIIRPLVGRVLMIIGMIGFMMLYAIPMVNRLLEDVGAEQTGLIKQILSIANLVNEHWIAVLTILLSLIVLVWFLLKYPLRYWWDYKKTRIPFLGFIFLSRDIISLYRFMGFAIQADMSVLQALTVSVDAVKNKAFKRELHKIMKILESGSKPFNVAIRGSKFISEIDRQSINMGLRTGRLDEQLLKMADIRERDLKVKTELLQQQMEPVVEVVTGAILGGVGILIYGMSMGAVASI